MNCMALSTPTNGDGTSPRSRRTTCARNTSSGRRTRKNRKNSSKLHNKVTGPLPGKPPAAVFLYPAAAQTGKPPVGPCVALCAGFVPRVGKGPAPGPQGPNSAPCQAGWKWFGKGQQKGRERGAGQRDGAVERPVPFSQRPAEPGASGFLRDFLSKSERCRFWGLGAWLRCCRFNFA